MMLQLKLNPKRINNQGAALITVMVVVFIVMAIIANLTVANFRIIKRLSNRQLIEQATAIAYSAIDFGRAGLGSSAATANIDTLQDVWAQPLPRTKVLGEIYMSGYVIDEQSKFNVNDLIINGQVNQNVVTQFSALLSYLNLPPSLAYNIAYYMAAPQFQNEIMMQYTMGKPAYRPAGRPLVDLSELILVKGATPAMVQKLVQYTTAIPVGGFALLNESSIESAPVAVNQPGAAQQNQGNITVNVNTATAEVIAAKSGIPLPVAQRMISYRLSQPFKSTADINTFLSQNGIVSTAQSIPSNQQQTLNLAGLGVNSSYFTIHAVIDNLEDRISWVALVYRQNRSGQWPQILWQHPE